MFNKMSRLLRRGLQKQQNLHIDLQKVLYLVAFGRTSTFRGSQHITSILKTAL